MQTERAELYFQQGSSDKVYHLQLENVQDQWSVQAQWGRRGSALQSDVKVSETSYEEAKRVYDRILREKTGKGYQIAQATANGDEALAVGLPATKEHSSHTPELLTPIEEPEALLLAQDASWWFQQEFDGRRLAVQKSEGKYTGINKLGQIIPIDSRLAESLDRVQAQDFLVDGEITDSRFYIWDLLSVNDMDLRIQPYEIRYVHLTPHFRGVSDVLRVCEQAMTTRAKRDFVKKMHDANAEGLYARTGTQRMRADERDNTSSASLSQRHPLSLARNPTRRQTTATLHRRVSLGRQSASFHGHRRSARPISAPTRGADRGSALPLLSPRTLRAFV